MLDSTIVNLLDLSGQVALITGASRGIGRAIATVFAQTGASLALLARTAGQLEQVAQSLTLNVESSNSILTLPADVADEVQVKRAVQKIVETWGRVDILINNAGLISFGLVTQVEPVDWERIIGANLTGAYLLSRAVAPVMMQQKSGRIINIASISAQTGGVSAGVHYAASKGGMVAMTKTLARDLAPYGITVNAIAPGHIDADPNLLTPEARQRIIQMIPLGRLGEPEEIAYAALFLASPMAAYITGATLDVNGGILKR
ncbi:MAG: 3-oxoacyl-ACP reductase FabG [Chloroflexi bacterium]|nr:3-oxoacyl-ACP reductase FabG [Chloroflexota bacterium]